MQISIDTSSEIVEIGLYDLQAKIIGNESWKSEHNESEVLIKKIDDLLNANKVQKDKLKRVVVCMGYGSYTALRVGISAANLLAYGLDIPVVGYEKSSDNLNIQKTLKTKIGDKFEKAVLPLYKKDPKITAKNV